MPNVASRPDRAASTPSRPPVVFVKYYDKGSTRLGADHIAEGLRSRGWNARVLFPQALRDLPRRAVLVFIKTSRLDHLLLARARGHRLVLDVQDTIVFKRRIKNRWLFDALIFRNQRALADFGRSSRDRAIYHHWDERYRPHRPVSGLTICYLGSDRSLDLWEQLPGVSFLNDDGWGEAIFQSAAGFDCHLSIRQPGREFLYKPNCKVSTAAACEAAIVTTADASTLELLGPDYPFYCGADRSSVLATIERARAAWQGPLWQLALTRMQAVRERTSLARELDAYETLLPSLLPA